MTKDEALVELKDVYDRHKADELNFGGDKNEHMGVSVPWGVVKVLAQSFCLVDKEQDDT